MNFKMTKFEKLKVKFDEITPIHLDDFGTCVAHYSAGVGKGHSESFRSFNARKGWIVRRMKAATREFGDCNGHEWCGDTLHFHVFLY